MKKVCVALSLLALCTLCGSVIVNPPIIQSLHDYATVGHPYQFRCIASEPLNKSSDMIVLINDKPSNGSKRLVTENFQKSGIVLYSFNGVQISDSGTKFRCMTGNMKSNELQMSVAYVLFDEANQTSWNEFNVNQTFSLKCTATSNPRLTSLKGSHTNKEQNNVVFKKPKTTEGVFTVTKAQLNNRGNYTCTASNGIVTSNMTYNTFIGGPPLDTSVTDIFLAVGKHIEIRFNITDNSPAPARGVRIVAEGLEMGNVSFDRPIMGGPMHSSYKLKKGLNVTAPDYYNFSITPYNTLGNGTSVSFKEFISGLNYTVDMTTSDNNVALYTNFTINCIASSQYVNLTLLVNDQPSEGDHRVTELYNKNGSARFVFKPTSPSHNGSVFRCKGVVSSSHKSTKEVAVNVLYAPVFMSSANATVWDEYAIASNYSLNCSLKYSGNPPSKLHYTTNNKKSQANVNITSSSSAVVYNVTKATAKNRDNFTCFAENKIGRSFITQLAYVGGPPSSVVNISIRVDNKEIVLLDLTISDHSDAPATEFFLNIEGVYHKTFMITGLPQTEYHYPNLLNMKFALFGDSGHRVVVTAKNKIGEAVVYNKTKNVPATISSTVIHSTSSSHAPPTSSHVTHTTPTSSHVTHTTPTSSHVTHTTPISSHVTHTTSTSSHVRHTTPTKSHVTKSSTKSPKPTVTPTQAPNVGPHLSLSEIIIISVVGGVLLVVTLVILVAVISCIKKRRRERTAPLIAEPPNGNYGTL